MEWIVERISKAQQEVDLLCHYVHPPPPTAGAFTRDTLIFVIHTLQLGEITFFLFSSLDCIIWQNK